MLLTAFGPGAFYLNRGDGTFVESAARAGVADSIWSTSASFFDADRDGDLDLYVASYVDFSLENHKFCGDSERGIRGYCHPDSYEGLPDRFYRNRGDGIFEDATEQVGLAGPREAGLGVIVADFDDDGWPDIYVANDLDPNQLFMNRGDGTFEDGSLLSGASHSPQGRAEAGMGLEAADFDGDGRLDLFVTNFALETNGLYRNLGGGLFLDQRYASKVAPPSFRFVGFGVAAQDFDHDADVDLFIANGHTLDNAAELSEVQQYAQRNQVLENLGDGVFRERTDAGVDVVRVEPRPRHRRPRRRRGPRRRDRQLQPGSRGLREPRRCRRSLAAGRRRGRRKEPSGDRRPTRAAHRCSGQREGPGARDSHRLVVPIPGRAHRALRSRWRRAVGARGAVSFRSGAALP